jgi:hypothetical protein
MSQHMAMYGYSTEAELIFELLNLKQEYGFMFLAYKMLITTACYWLSVCFESHL